MKEKTQKGITLIALILTVLILLILAIVTITGITSDGTLSRANSAATLYNQKAAEEQGLLGIYGNYLNNIVGGEIADGGTEDGTLGGDTGADEELPDKVSGVWTLNQSLSISYEDFGYGSSYPVNFSVNGQNYTSVVFWIEMGDLCLSYNSTCAWLPGIAANYLGQDSGWQFTNANIIDFGTENQTVDETFKTWLVANATKGMGEGVQVVKPTVSGVWTFNTKVSGFDNYTNISQDINFTSNGSSYNYIMLQFDTVDYYLRFSGTEVYYTAGYASLYGKTAGWQSNGYKVVDFGTQEQEVSQTFKDWLEANATEGNNYQTVSVSATTWKFNDTITAINLTEAVSFTANNTQYSSIAISQNEAGEVYYDTTAVYYSYAYQNIWKGDYEECYWEDPPAGPGGGPYLGEHYGNSVYKTITFAEGAMVSQEFYTWLTANATQQ